MPLNLLALLLCLLAVLPQRVCACEAEHSDHAAPVSSHHDDSESPDEIPADGKHHDHGDPSDQDCPCQCHAAPRESLPSPRSGNEHATGVEVTSSDGFADPPVTIAPVLPANPRLEPPPGRLHPSLPLFLSISRLLN